MVDPWVGDDPQVLVDAGPGDGRGGPRPGARGGDPGFPDRPVTARQLLTHTSGLTDGQSYAETYACADPGIRAQVLHRPEDEVAVIVLANRLVVEELLPILELLFAEGIGLSTPRRPAEP